MKHAVPHSARMRAGQGLPLLNEGIRHFVQLSHQLYAVQCAMAQARGHVRIRLEHVVAGMREELNDLEFAIRAVEHASAPGADEERARIERSITTTREESIQ